MKQDALNKLKANAFDYVFKGLIAVVCFLVKDMREDVKLLMQSVPGLQAKVEMLTDQQLINKFRIIKMMPGKQEDEITIDSIKNE
jgi:hypothetical protein